MALREVIQKNINDAATMQLATLSNNKPWICTVHSVADDDLYVYWLSLPSRRHSKELNDNHNAAIALVVKPENPVIGIQGEGEVSIVEDESTVEEVMALYVPKFGKGQDFLANFQANKNEHKLYKLTPSKIALFDEVNFAGNPQQTFTP